MRNAPLVELLGTQVLSTLRGRAAGLAVGVRAQTGAELYVSDSEVSGTEGPGTYVVTGGRAVLDRVLLTGNRCAGVLVASGSLALTASTITGTVPDDEWGGGFGVYSNTVAGPSTFTLTDSTIGPHDYAAVWLDGPGSYDITGNTLSGSAGFDQGGHVLHGNAVFAENGVTAWDGATGLLLSENTFFGATQIGVFLDGSAAELDGNTWSGNGTDVRQQDCDGADGIEGPVENEDGTSSIDDIAYLTDGDLLGVPRAVVCPYGNDLTAYDVSFDTLYLPSSETQE